MIYFWFALAMVFGSMTFWMAVILSRQDRFAEALHMECLITGVAYDRDDPKLTLKRLIDWYIAVEREHTFVGPVAWTSQEALDLMEPRDELPPIVNSVMTNHPFKHGPAPIGLYRKGKLNDSDQ